MTQISHDFGISENPNTLATWGFQSRIWAYESLYGFSHLYKLMCYDVKIYWIPVSKVFDFFKKL